MSRSIIQCAVTFACIALLVPEASRAQTWAESVWTQLQQQYMDAMDAGYVSETFVVGKLKQGEKVIWSLDLKEGAYEFRAACDGDCMDVDLRIYDSQGELASDTAADFAPFLEIEVMTGGMFDVEVEMYSCASEPCYYGVGVFYQP